MYSVRIEPAKLILVGTRITYQATGGARTSIMLTRVYVQYHTVQQYYNPVPLIMRTPAALSMTKHTCTPLSIAYRGPCPPSRILFPLLISLYLA